MNRCCTAGVVDSFSSYFNDFGIPNSGDEALSNAVKVVSLLSLNHCRKFRSPLHTHIHTTSTQTDPGARLYISQLNAPSS